MFWLRSKSILLSNEVGRGSHSRFGCFVVLGHGVMEVTGKKPERERRRFSRQRNRCPAEASTSALWALLRRSELIIRRQPLQPTTSPLFLLCFLACLWENIDDVALDFLEKEEHKHIIRWSLTSSFYYCSKADRLTWWGELRVLLVTEGLPWEVAV